MKHCDTVFGFPICTAGPDVRNARFKHQPSKDAVGGDERKTRFPSVPCASEITEFHSDLGPFIYSEIIHIFNIRLRALHLAVIHEHEAFLESILQYTQRTDYLDIQNDLGQTALHIAVILGASDFVSKLVCAGAGLCIQEKGGHTPLHLACREGQRECAQQLLAAGVMQRPCQGSSFKAQLDCTNYDGYTPLHVAVLRKDVNMVSLLISAGSDLNKPELSCGRSPLHLAVESQNPDLVECLLSAGADPEARMYVGYTPLYSALHRSDQKIPQLLRHFGSEEPDWDSDESLDSNSEEEYDDIVINLGH